MDSAKEIRDRITSVRDTRKITNAMYLISSNKLRKAMRELEKTLPYFLTLRKGIKFVFDNLPDASSRYVDIGDKRPESAKVRGYLVVTADKGLSGAYNHNVLKLAMEHLHDTAGAKLYVVGRFGRQYFLQKGVEVEHSFFYTAQNPNLYRSGEIAAALLDAFDHGALDEIYVIYTVMRNSIVTEATMRRVLPFERKHFSSQQAAGESKYDWVASEIASYEFYPTVEKVLDSVVRSYLSGYIYSVLVDSFCAEQNSRMSAMDTASRNANEMLSVLSLKYNSVRQAAITQEITEVTAGARAQKLHLDEP